MRDGPLTERTQPPPALRWGVLVFVSVAMFGNYYVSASRLASPSMDQTIKTAAQRPANHQSSDPHCGP